MIPPASSSSAPGSPTTATTNWTTSSGGNNGVWADNLTPIFAGAAGTVTLAQPVAVHGMKFTTGGYTLTSSTITLGDATTNPEGIANNAINTANAGTTTIASAIAGASGLAKTGAGTLVLGGNNTYSGGTTITTGTLQLGADNVLPDATALSVASGATLDVNSRTDTIGSLAGDGGVALGSGTLTAGGNDSTTTLSGGISGSGGNFIKAGSGTMTLSGSSAYTGTTGVTAGTLRLGLNNALSDSTAVTVSSGATFDVNGRTDTIGSLAGGGLVTLGSGALTAGADNSSTTYSGIMSGDGSFTKTGAGVMTLTGAGNYTGPTTVSAGTLLVDGDSSAATGLVTVDSGATLGGIGTVGGNTVINGLHAPGSNGLGVQNFSGGITYDPGSTFLWELGSETTSGRGTAFDAVNAVSVVSISSAAVFDMNIGGLDITGSFWDSDRVWDIFDADSLSGGFTSFALHNAASPGAPVDYSGQGAFSFDTASGELRWIAAVPEPSSVLTAALSFFAGLLRRRRRERAA